MRAALRDWLLSSLPPLELREARSVEEALEQAAQAQSVVRGGDHVGE